MLISQPVKWTVAAALSVLCVTAVFSMPLAAQGTDIVTDPLPFLWNYHPVTAENPEAYYSGVMEIGESTFMIGGETMTTRAYRQAAANTRFRDLR